MEFQTDCSGRFVKRERWRAKRKLMSGSNYRGVSVGLRAIVPGKILRLYMENPVI